MYMSYNSSGGYCAWLIQRKLLKFKWPTTLFFRSRAVRFDDNKNMDILVIILRFYGAYQINIRFITVIFRFSY